MDTLLRGQLDCQLSRKVAPANSYYNNSFRTTSIFHGCGHTPCSEEQSEEESDASTGTSEDDGAAKVPGSLR